MVKFSLVKSDEKNKNESEFVSKSLEIESFIKDVKDYLRKRK